MKIKCLTISIVLMLAISSVAVSLRTHNFAKAQSPEPELRVEPATYSATDLDEIFTVNITINDLDEILEAVAVQFRLCYNDTLLEALNVTEGPFMKQFGDTFFVYFIESDVVHGPSVVVGILLLPNAETGEWSDFLKGEGTLATITFKAVYQHRGMEKPPLCCGLTLVDTMIMDQNLEERAHETQSGQYCMFPRPRADINNDGKVDMKDIGIAAKAFGSYPGHERWNPIVDLNEDDKVDMRDIATVARWFGWSA